MHLSSPHDELRGHCALGRLHGEAKLFEDSRRVSDENTVPTGLDLVVNN